MIDAEGFRANVGIVICNTAGQLLWTRRKGHDSWQFPQGGINLGETPEQTLFRELHEETGLQTQDVRVLGSTRDWLRYRLPTKYVRHDSKPLCIGQKQRWFLLLLQSDESHIEFNVTDHPEFDAWMWVNYWYPVRQVIAFKREVYRQALAELLPAMAQTVRQSARAVSSAANTLNANKNVPPNRSAPTTPNRFAQHKRKKRR